MSAGHGRTHTGLGERPMTEEPRYDRVARGNSYRVAGLLPGLIAELAPAPRPYRRPCVDCGRVQMTTRQTPEGRCKARGECLEGQRELA